MDDIEKLFRGVYDKHLRSLTRILKNKASAEDVLQDSFVKALRYYPTFDNTRWEIKKWFNFIVFSCMRDMMRKEKREKDKAINFHDLTKDMEDVDNLLAFSKLLTNLSSLDSDIVRMCFYTGYKGVDVAKIKNVSESYVKKVCSSFRKLLKDNSNDFTLSNS